MHAQGTHTLMQSMMEWVHTAHLDARPDSDNQVLTAHCVLLVAYIAARTLTMRAGMAPSTTVPKPLYKPEMPSVLSMILAVSFAPCKGKAPIADLSYSRQTLIMWQKRLERRGGHQASCTRLLCNWDALSGWGLCLWAANRGLQQLWHTDLPKDQGAPLQWPSAWS